MFLWLILPFYDVCGFWSAVKRRSKTDESNPGVQENTHPESFEITETPVYDSNSEALLNVRLNKSLKFILIVNYSPYLAARNSC